MSTNRFCTGCGTPLDAGSRFCGSCGKPVNAAAAGDAAASPPPSPSFAPPPPPVYSAPAPPAPAYSPPPVAPAGEYIFGAVPSVSRKKGLMSVESFNVIVTDKRMIFARMTNEMVAAEVQRVSKDAGFFGGIAAAATVGYTLYRRYLTMSPDAVLQETPGNFAVNISSIRRVNMEAGKRIDDYQTMKRNQGSIIKQHQYSSGKFEVEAAGETLKFDLPGSSLDTAVETLKKAGLYR